MPKTHIPAAESVAHVLRPHPAPHPGCSDWRGGGGHKYVGLRQTAYLSQFMWAGDVRGWGWGCLTAGGAPNCDPAYTKHLYLVYAGWANSPRREIRGGGGEGGAAGMWAAALSPAGVCEGDSPALSVPRPPSSPSTLPRNLPFGNRERLYRPWSLGMGRRGGREGSPTNTQKTGRDMGGILHVIQPRYSGGRRG